MSTSFWTKYKTISTVYNSKKTKGPKEVCDIFWFKSCNWWTQLIKSSSEMFFWLIWKRSWKVKIKGEVNDPTLYPWLINRPSNILVVEPLPLVPVTWITGKPSWGLSRSSKAWTTRSNPWVGRSVVWECNQSMATSTAGCWVIKSPSITDSVVPIVECGLELLLFVPSSLHVFDVLPRQPFQEHGPQNSHWPACHRHVLFLNLSVSILLADA